MSTGFLRSGLCREQNGYGETSASDPGVSDVSNPALWEGYPGGDYE